MNKTNRFTNMKWFSISICVTMALLSAGCSASVTSTSVPIPTTVSFTPTPTTILPSATPSPTQTRTPQPSTLTPFPVLQEPDEIKTKLFELLQNNGGCELPCLFGYTPGTASPQEMKNFFDQFALVQTPEMFVRKGTSKDGSLSGVSFYFLYVQDMYLNMHISAYKSGNHTEVLAMDAFPQSKWEPHYAEVMNYYLLPQILTTYGMPPQILVATYRDDRQRPDITSAPFFLVIIYPERGLYMKYEMNRETGGDKFIGCPSKSFVSMAVWSPGDNEALSKVVQVMNNGGDLSSYKSIDKATSMISEEFYQVFSNSANKDCIETPIETWPNP